MYGFYGRLRHVDLPPGEGVVLEINEVRLRHFSAALASARVCFMNTPRLEWIRFPPLTH